MERWRPHRPRSRPGAGFMLQGVWSAAQWKEVSAGPREKWNPRREPPAPTQLCRKLGLSMPWGTPSPGECGGNLSSEIVLAVGYSFAAPAH